MMFFHMDGSSTTFKFSLRFKKNILSQQPIYIYVYMYVCVHVCIYESLRLGGLKDLGSFTFNCGSIKFLPEK